MSDEEKDRPEDAAPEEERDGGTDEKRENDTAPVRDDGGKDGGGKKDNGSDEAARKFVMAFGYIIWILFLSRSSFTRMTPKPNAVRTSSSTC